MWQLSNIPSTTISACSHESVAWWVSFRQPCRSCAFWTAENNPMLRGARSSLIVDNQVLRGRPLGRFHLFGGTRAPLSAIRVSAVDAKREVWPKRDSRRAFVQQCHAARIEIGWKKLSARICYLGCRLKEHSIVISRLQHRHHSHVLMWMFRFIRLGRLIKVVI